MCTQWNINDRISFFLFFPPPHNIQHKIHRCDQKNMTIARVAAKFSSCKRFFERSEAGPFICPSQTLKALYLVQVSWSREMFLSFQDERTEEAGVWSFWSGQCSSSGAGAPAPQDRLMCLMKRKLWLGNYGWCLPHILFNWNWAEMTS